MTSPLRSDEAVQRPLAAGLRERKKARTRAAIQEHAMRLFRAQGYAATTVEEIAAAAEVSPSTFFRYFRTKEDVVAYDALDPVLVAAYRAQPAHLGPIAALRGAIAGAYRELPADARAREQERQQLFQAVPELRARLLGELVRNIDLLAQVVAERSGRTPDDLRVRTLAGALVGTLMSVLPLGADATDDLFDEATLVRLDAALAHLQAGLPL